MNGLSCKLIRPVSSASRHELGVSVAIQPAEVSIAGSVRGDVDYPVSGIAYPLWISLSSNMSHQVGTSPSPCVSYLLSRNSSVTHRMQPVQTVRYIPEITVPCYRLQNPTFWLSQISTVHCLSGPRKDAGGNVWPRGSCFAQLWHGGICLHVGSMWEDDAINPMAALMAEGSVPQVSVWQIPPCVPGQLSQPSVLALRQNGRWYQPTGCWSSRTK